MRNKREPGENPFFAGRRCGERESARASDQARTEHARRGGEKLREKANRKKAAGTGESTRAARMNTAGLRI